MTTAKEFLEQRREEVAPTSGLAHEEHTDSEEFQDFLKHYGVLGMKWGVITGGSGKKIGKPVAGTKAAKRDQPSMAERRQNSSSGGKTSSKNSSSGGKTSSKKSSSGGKTSSKKSSKKSSLKLKRNGDTNKSAREVKRKQAAAKRKAAAETRKKALAKKKAERRAAAEAKKAAIAKKKAAIAERNKKEQKYLDSARNRQAVVRDADGEKKLRLKDYDEIKGRKAKISSDAVANRLDKALQEMSNKELRDYIERQDLERRYRELTVPKPNPKAQKQKKGGGFKQAVKKAAADVILQSASTVGKEVLTNSLRKQAKKLVK